MAYYYDPNSSTVVQIVKKVLVAVGNYESHLGEKQIQGIYWRNPDRQTGFTVEDGTMYRLKGSEPILFDALLNLSRLHPEFFENIVLPKLDYGMIYWEMERDRHFAMAGHRPSEVQYGIFHVLDDYGFKLAEVPEGFVTITTVGDEILDRSAAQDEFAKQTGKKDYRTGFYKAVPTSKEQVEQKIGEYETEIAMWGNGLA